MDIVLEEEGEYSMPKIFDSLETEIEVHRSSKENRVFFPTKEGITPADYIKEIERIGKCNRCFTEPLHTTAGITFFYKDDTAPKVVENKKDIYIFWKDGEPEKVRDVLTGNMKRNYEKAHYKLTVNVKII